MIPIKDINPTTRFPLITILLIAANVVLFLYQTALGSRAEASFIASYAFVPERLFRPEAAAQGPVPVAATLFSSMFLHGGLFHLGGNMLYLWIFGNNVEDAMSRVRYVIFYVLCGLAATASHAFMNASSPVPLIGASGAVSGVLGAYLLLFPRAKVLTLVAFGFYIRTIAVPAMIVLGFWFVLQFLNAIVSSGGGGGVAWFAHIGGFITGMALVGIFKRRDMPFWGGRSYRSL